VLDLGAPNHLAAGDNGFTVQASGSGAKVSLANGDKVPIKRHGHVPMDVGNGETKARMALTEAVFVPDPTSNLLSVLAIDRISGAVLLASEAPKPRFKQLPTMTGANVRYTEQGGYLRRREETAF